MAPLPAGRGGPQRIPRPADARLGGPPPWLDRDLGLEPIRLATIESVVGARPARRFEAPGAPESAVLILLYEHDQRVHIVLTRRAAELRHHAHEVAFPGGRRDADDPDLWSTALREAEEETSLDRSSVRLVGRLDSRMTGGSQTLVHPFVGAVDERPELRPSPDEVEAIRHVPLDDLLHPDAWREEVWSIDGAERAITFFELTGDTVWGATGAILRQLLVVVTGAART